MTDRYVFGYGSLVNPATHTYQNIHPARIAGWRRVWRHIEGRSVAFLTIERDENSEIDGLIASVPEADWAALDEREREYLREPASGLQHPLPQDTHVVLYHAPAELHRPHSGHHPILLSYIDVVVQGYFRQFGEQGVTEFFATTANWDAPIKNDRAKPIYPRHQQLTQQETEIADHWLKNVGAKFL